MVPFAGWEMPVQYTSIIEEHKAVRTAAGLFDVSHMGEVEVSGPEAAAFLDFLVTGHISALAPGRARYTMMCYDDGGVVDDVIVTRLEPEKFLVCVNAANAQKDVDWMIEKAVGFECAVNDVSAAWALLALQGPASAAILQALTQTPLGELKRFAVVETTVAERTVLLSRTGYTGEAGFELYIAPDDAVAVADALMEAGAAAGLLPVGLGARDSLRMEAGYPLYGHEINASINPLAAGLGWTVKLKKPVRFLGQKALRAVEADGPSHQVVWFRLAGRRIAREGTDVQAANGEKVGRVLSGTLSPLLGQPIGSALVESAALATDGPLSVDLRGNLMELERAQPPLHQS